MAKRIASIATFSPTAQADGTLTSSTYFAGGGNSALAASIDVMIISDIIQSGQATSSAFNAMCLTRSSTNGATPTALALPNSDGFIKQGGTGGGTAPTWFWAATTNSARAPAVTLARLQLGFNSFGGTLRTAFAPGNEWMSVGAAGTANGIASQSENIFSCHNSGGTTAGAQSISVTYEII